MCTCAHGLAHVCAPARKPVKIIYKSMIMKSARIYVVQEFVDWAQLRVRSFMAL